MFVLSQYLLNASGMCKTQQILSYSIALGLILYSSIYLYLLFYNNEYLSIFNKFIIYIVVVDLLLSAFYYFNLQEKEDTPALHINDTDDGDQDVDDEDDEDDEDNESEVEYVGSDEDEEEGVDKPELDIDSQKYIDNLIAQARLSDQQRMTAFMQQQAEQSGETEHDAPELIDSVHQEEEETESPEDTVSQQIESIIDEVVTKKKQPKRAPKKKQASAPVEI